MTRKFSSELGVTSAFGARSKEFGVTSNPKRQTPNPELRSTTTPPNRIRPKRQTPGSKLVALLLAWLVLTIPAVFAQQLNIQRFSGQDNVQDYARENDELTILARATMQGAPTQDAARERLRVYYGNTFEFFDTCSPIGDGYYDCAYKTQELVYAGKDDYAIRLYDADGTQLKEEQRTLTVDIFAPAITQFIADPMLARAAQAVTLTYAVEDYGRQPGLTEDCAGIKSIRITADGQDVTVISGSPGQCALRGTTTYRPSGIVGEKRIRLCAIPTDHVGHQGFPECTDLVFDDQAPRIVSLKLVEQGGTEVTHVRTGQVANVDVIITILDASGIVQAQTLADLSKLNPALGRSAPTAAAGDKFVWAGVAVTTPQTCQVSVETIDRMGNPASKTLTCTLPIDDTGPELTFFGTEFSDDDETPLLGKEGIIVARFKETGSGLNKRNAFIDASRLGLSAAMKASACKALSAEEWECTWRVRPPTPTGDYLITLLAQTRDDLDNLLGTQQSATVRLDKTPPREPKLVEIASFREQERVVTSATFRGEVIEFVVESADFSTATADFRTLGGKNDTPAERCTGNQTKQCTFSATVGVSGPQKAAPVFTFADKAGNKAALVVPIDVLAIADEPEPNYWEASVQCSPLQLDRNVMSIYDYPAYCRVQLSSANPDAETLSVQGPVDPTQCSGQIEWLSDITTTNTPPGTKEPFIGLTFVAADYSPFEQLTIACPLRITTRVGDFIALNPEPEEVTLTLPLYRSPLGNVYENVEDEIQDVKKRVEGVWETIGQLSNIFGYVRTGCNLMNTMANLLVSIETTLYMLGIVELITPPPFDESIKSAERPICVNQEITKKVYNYGIFRFVKPLCDFATCQMGLPDALKELGVATDWNPQWSEGLYDYLSVGNEDYKNQLRGAVNQESGFANPETYLNVEDSLVYSIVIPPLCIPGIIYNLDKWRQIECKYGLCLAQDVKEAGIPVRACKDQKSYMQCRFVVGEIFNVIPFLPILNYHLNLYRQFFSDPLLALTLVAGAFLKCDAKCLLPKGIGTGHWACNAMAFISNLADTVNIIKDMGKTYEAFQERKVNQQWCNEFEEVVGK